MRPRSSSDEVQVTGEIGRQMAKTEPAAPAPRLTAVDALLLVTLALLWGSAFPFLKVAVETVPPVTTAAMRVTLAAGIAFLYMKFRGRRLPRNPRTWAWTWLSGLCGLALPYGLIAWGQQTIPSALAAICMASVPLFTLPLAHVFTRDEKITPARAVGVAMGFGGIALLFGGGLDDGTSAVNPWGILAVLGGAFSYSMEALVLRRLSRTDGATLAAMVLICAVVMLVPASLIIDRPWQLRPDASSLAAIVYLAVFPTAISTLLLVILVARVGATITSLNNYLVPLVGVVLGILLLGEEIRMIFFVAFGIILAGVYVTSHGGTKKLSS